MISWESRHLLIFAHKVLEMFLRWNSAFLTAQGMIPNQTLTLWTSYVHLLYCTVLPHFYVKLRVLSVKTVQPHLCQYFQMHSSEELLMKCTVCYLKTVLILIFKVGTLLKLVIQWGMIMIISAKKCTSNRAGRVLYIGISHRDVLSLCVVMDTWHFN